jgi:hypothetical protein
MAPAYASLKTDILDAVLTKMVDNVHVLHDHAVSSTLAMFSNDYATGKGIFMRHALGVAKLINNKTLEDCIFASANYAWNTAAVDPDFSRLFRFAWNKKGKLPRGLWDNTDNQASSTRQGPFADLNPRHDGVLQPNRKRPPIESDEVLAKDGRQNVVSRNPPSV